MPTPNFKLPLINGTSPISIVNDMNALATATDAALGKLANATDLESIRTTANNAAATANTAAATAETAKGAAETANAAAVAAQSAATAAQSAATAANGTANTALANAGKANADIANLFNFHQIAKQTQTEKANIDITVLLNANATLFKFYGYIRCVNGTINLTAIPGGDGNYGYKVDCHGALAKKYFEISTGGLGAWDQLSNVLSRIGQSTAAVGSDGNLYLGLATTTTITTSATALYLQLFPSCVYVNAALGDAPTTINPSNN